MQRMTDPSPTENSAGALALPAGLVADEAHDADGVLRARCAWCKASPLYRHYHDHEWGFPVADDRRLFEKICLEGFQSGVS